MSADTISTSPPNNLIFFVHIPKTAGSSVNHHLKKNLRKGFVHCEHFFYREQVLRKKVSGARWLSGHVTFNTARKTLEQIGIPNVHFFSCVRTPHAQVMSHLNWLVAIRHKSLFFFKQHPKLVQDISNDIISSGVDNKNQVLNVLKKHHWLFMNTQWNILFSPEEQIDETLVKEHLALFDYVGTDTNIRNLVLKITRKDPIKPKTVNQSKYYFDPDIFQDEEITSYLATHNQKDLYLYEAVKSTFK